MLRVCPKLMKVLTGFIALLPVLWATTPGVGPMTPVAIPVIGSAAAPGIHVLRLVPVYYILYERWEQWKESWTVGGTESTEKQDANAEVAKSE